MAEQVPYCKNLAQRWTLGDLVIKNRVAMASMTRNRGAVPIQATVDYYAQRVSAGIIMTEGILVEPQGSEWPEAPGLVTEEQVAGWIRVVDSVHKKGGVIFAQLWHLGRAANAQMNNGEPPLAPSAIPAQGGSFRLLVGKPGYSVPQAVKDPRDLVDLFRRAAVNAKRCGFDGVEVHGANGYLVHQFLEKQSNHRTDHYGGSAQNRARFALEVIDALCEVFPPTRVAIKLTPCGGYNYMGDDSAESLIELYTYLIKELDKRGIGYIQLLRYLASFDKAKTGNPFDLERFLPLLAKTKLIWNGEFTPKEADNLIGAGKGAAVSFGRAFIPNPDLPYRMFYNLELADPIDLKSYYVYPNNDKRVGYSDYPFHPANPVEA